MPIDEPIAPGGNRGGRPQPQALPDRSSFVSWVDFHNRSQSLALALGAQTHFVAVGRPRLLTAPIRHLVQGARTALILAKTRPRTLLVMAPPLPLVLLGLVYVYASGARLVIDAHTAAVLDRRTGTQMKPWFPKVARRAHLTIVTTDLLAGMLRARGVEAAVLNDALSMSESYPEPAHNELSSVVMPASWDRDEPISQVVEMARRLPDVDVAITGHPRRATRGLGPIPPNLRLTGWLKPDAYASLLQRSDAVLALTTAEATMQQAAYEAVGYGKPLVLSDTKALRDYFTSSAVFVDPRDPTSIAKGVASALENKSELGAQSVSLRVERTAQWDLELASVIDRLDHQPPRRRARPS